MSRVMIVTGSRKGIGRGIVEHYLAQGWKVAGCSRGPFENAPEGYRHFEVDVADEQAVVRMVGAVRREFGQIDALINNAGIASMNHAFLTPLAKMEQIFATNTFGTFLFCREVGKVMMQKKSGRIVNFATVATPLKLEGEAAYAASKAAVESLTQVLAQELGQSGITVNAVGPTPVDTDLIKSVPKDKMDALVARQAIHRKGTIDDVINICDFFIKPESDFVTGQVVYMGGVC